MARTKYERGYFGAGRPDPKIEINIETWLTPLPLDVVIDMQAWDRLFWRLLGEALRVPDIDIEPKPNGGGDEM